RVGKGKIFLKMGIFSLVGGEKKGGFFFKNLPPLFLPAGISGFASARPRIFFVPHAGESPFLV
ncbi:hypothetical protein, partial [Bacteroides fragilis]|uniref:hypothetical protein n=1 Tax=Bacteroides fragilis TaxID=817 RepID=UPI0022AB2F91